MRIPWAVRCLTPNSIMQNKRGKRIQFAAAAFWLAVWQAAALLVGRDFLLASPVQVLLRLAALCVFADFWLALLHSAARILLGFLIGLLCGAGAAACSARWRAFRVLIAPLYAVLRAIPVASYVILALLWLPARSLSTCIAALVVFPLCYADALAEIERADPEMLEMARLFQLPARRRILYCYVLPALPAFAKSCATALGLAWKSGVAAELICIPAGTIGERLYRAKVYLMTGDLLAWTAAIILLSAASARIFARLLRTAAARLEGRTALWR